MKYMILTILILISFKFGLAQNCLYEKNEIDKFTDKEILITTPVVFINFSEKMKCSLSRIDLYKFFILELTTGKSLYSIEEDNLLYIIFENGTKTTFKPEKLITFSNKIQGYNYIKVVYGLEDIELLEKSQISEIRVTTANSYFDYMIKKKRAKDFFIDGLDCIK